MTVYDVMNLFLKIQVLLYLMSILSG